MRVSLKGIILGGVLVSGVVFSGICYRLLTQPLLPASSTPLVFVIDKNTSAISLAKRLKSKGLIKSSRLFLMLVRFKNIAHRIKAGVYEIVPGETQLDFMRKVVKGKVMVESFAIIAGTTANQISANLSRAPFLNYHPDAWLAVQNGYINPEGLLLAETYQYNAGSDAFSLLQLAHQNLMTYLQSCWDNRREGLPYQSPYELIIVASILEKEAALFTEKRLISGVIVNRLDKKMRLQMDPTVIYALGENYHGQLTHQDLAIDSPYNTYRYGGLPPTPIAMVSKEALAAAANPAETNYLYFVAKGDGSHHFSVNYEEQKNAVFQYQKNE